MEISMTAEKQLVEHLTKTKSQESENTETLARLLDTFTNTVFGEVKLSIFELLQNADDASDKEGLNVDVKILLEKDLIIVQHNGRDFNEEDVRSICNINSSKAKSNDKIGYKGIGFKSLFSFSDYVLIKSGNYSFRFDKSYWKERSNHIPWQITPIWTDEYSNFEDYLEDGKTTFVIKVQQRLLELEDGMTEISRIMNKTLSNDKIILFLRHIRSINLNSFLKIERERFPSKTQIIQKIIKSKRGKIKNDWKEHKSNLWLLKNFDLSIGEKQKKSLQLLPDIQCPEKLKNSRITRLTFGVEIDEAEDILANKDKNKIYCYFPTNTKMYHNFPFVVNGDFLLNATRTGAIGNCPTKYKILIKSTSCRYNILII
jgi:hypothetical protein